MSAQPRIAIIGAGPGGISCALTLREQGFIGPVDLYDSGRPYRRRYCPVDHGQKCNGCNNRCNVISGYGGCVHYGDAVKLSRFPSGRRLSELLEKNVAEAAMERTISLWTTHGNALNFIEPGTSFNDIQTKPYPVAEASPTVVKAWVEQTYENLSKRKVQIKAHSEVVRLERTAAGFEVCCRTLSQSSRETYDFVVVAVGRKGWNWWNSEVQRLCISHEAPTISVGLRFEGPNRTLAQAASFHPDFKTTLRIGSDKFKTFCFCSGKGGGQIKYTDYGELTLLDGHTHSKGSSDVGNFALLMQLRHECGQPWDWETVQARLVQPYVNLRTTGKGRPVVQHFADFRENTFTRTSLSCIEADIGVRSSVRDLEAARLSSLFTEKHRASMAAAFETIIDRISPTSTSVRAASDEFMVLGLELESLWNELELSPHMETNVEGLFAIGDCSGIAQGILQAGTAGIVVADELVRRAA